MYYNVVAAPAGQCLPMTRMLEKLPPVHESISLLPFHHSQPPSLLSIHFQRLLLIMPPPLILIRLLFVSLLPVSSKPTLHKTSLHSVTCSVLSDCLKSLSLHVRSSTNGFRVFMHKVQLFGTSFL